jgi:hypothetical protein
MPSAAFIPCQPPGLCHFWHRSLAPLFGVGCRLSEVRAAGFVHH